MILAGDIGGTNSRLGFFNVSKGRVEPVQISIFPSRSHANLEEIVREFIKQYSFDPKAACFGIAGPISKGRSEAVNLAWTVDSAKLAKELKLTEVKLLNDLEANAWGIAALGPDDLFELSAGDPGSVGNMAVIAAGTGLGEAGLYWDGAHHWPFPSEGGHTDFGP